LTVGAVLAAFTVTTMSSEDCRAESSALRRRV